MNEIEILGNSFVRYVRHLGTDQSIVDSARVSYLDSSKGEEQDKKLLNYLFKNKHTSPFEQVNITFNIRMPIFCMRQLVRHRTFRLNEVSARYMELDLGYYVPKKWRAQDTKNKQGGIDADMNDAFLNNVLIKQSDDCHNTYKDLLSIGVAREMARIVLPVNFLTEIIVNIDLSNLIKFFILRDDAHAQWEIREIAKAMIKITEIHFPWCMELYHNLKIKDPK